MPLIRVDAADDPRLAPFRLKERGLASRADKRDDAGAGMFLAEGDLVVERAFRAGCRPVLALADGNRLPTISHELAELVDVYVAGDELRALVTRLGIPQPIIALFARPGRPTPAELAASTDRLVIVEGVDNPSNVGSIVRNAAGLGWGGLVLDNTSADPLARRALRVAMGTAFSLPHARTNDLLGFLRGLGDMELYAMTPRAGATHLRTVTPGPRRAILIGSERAGLSAKVLDIARPVMIPMAGEVDSLNAAAATAIACFALGGD